MAVAIREILLWSLILVMLVNTGINQQIEGILTRCSLFQWSVWQHNPSCATLIVLALWIRLTSTGRRFCASWLMGFLSTTFFKHYGFRMIACARSDPAQERMAAQEAAVLLRTFAFFALVSLCIQTTQLATSVLLVIHQPENRELVLSCPIVRSSSAASALNPFPREDRLLCPVCLEHEKGARISPCGHTMCWTGPCRGRLNPRPVCPICRGPIGSIERMFL